MGIQARRYGAATPSCGEPAPDLREANRIRHGRSNRYRRVSGPPCDIGRTACLYRKLDSAIMVMKSAEDGRRYDAASVVDGAMDRSVLVEGSMSPQLVIIDGILRQNPA